MEPFLNIAQPYITRPPYSSPLFSSCGFYSIEHSDSVNQEAVEQWTSAQPDL